MFIFRTLLIVLLFTTQTEAFAKQESKPYEVVVSLGNMCQVAHQLDVNLLRNVAYPFDWVIIPFPSLYFFIANEGQHFLQPDRLVFFDNHPDALGEVKSFVKEMNYQIEFLHDFALSPDFMKDYNEIKEKYDRRVLRFFELLKSTKKILFVRRGITYKEAVSLDKLLRKKYPHLDYTILALDNTEEIKKEWGLKRVKNYYLRELEPWSWVGDPWAWNEILQRFPFAK